MRTHKAFPKSHMNFMTSYYFIGLDFFLASFKSFLSVWSCNIRQIDRHPRPLWCRLLFVAQSAISRTVGEWIAIIN